MFSLHHVSQPFLKMRTFLLDMRKDFLIISNFYLVEILSQPNGLTIVTSKKILKMSNDVLILSIFFLIMRIRNLQCKNIKLTIEINSIKFLDTHLHNKDETYVTKVYRKEAKIPARWSSQIPKRYKRNSIKVDLHHAKKIFTNF